MTTIEKIKTEIERRLKNGEKKILLGESNPYYDTDVMSTLANLLSFISSLESEKPMNKKGLEREIERCLWKLSDDPSNEELRMFARHFAKWQKDKMMQEAVEGEITKDNRGNNVLRVGLFNNGFEVGDKVHMIVLPKEG